MSIRICEFYQVIELTCQYDLAQKTNDSLANWRKIK